MVVRSETPEPVGADQSLGDLVALATRLSVMAAFVACLVIVLLCIAYGLGLIALGIWPWAAFLIVTGTCVLLAGTAVLIGALKFRGLSGLRQTRKTVQQDLSLLKRDDGSSAQ